MATILTIFIGLGYKIIAVSTNAFTQTYSSANHFVKYFLTPIFYILLNDIFHLLLTI